MFLWRRRVQGSVVIVGLLFFFCPLGVSVVLFMKHKDFAPLHTCINHLVIVFTYETISFSHYLKETATPQKGGDTTLWSFFFAENTKLIDK